MFSRKNGEESGTELPKEWIDECQNLLESVYSKQCTEYEKYFNVYSAIYSNELVVITSILHKNSANGIPSSIFLSTDIDEKTDNKKTLNNMIDASGMVIDTIFSETQNDDDNFILNWNDLSFKNQKMYYKISRENIMLTIEANKLLND